MKYLKLILLISACLFVTASFSACGDSTEQTEQKGKEYTATYVCPMHCDGSGSEEMGKCPVCGMDYVKNEEHKSDGHTH